MTITSTFVGLRMRITWVTGLAGPMAPPDAGIIVSWNVLGTAAWNRKSFSGTPNDEVAVSVIITRFALSDGRSNAKSTRSPFFSYAVIVASSTKKVKLTLNKTLVREVLSYSEQLERLPRSCRSGNWSLMIPVGLTSRTLRALRTWASRAGWPGCCWLSSAGQAGHRGPASTVQRSSRGRRGGRASPGSMSPQPEQTVYSLVNHRRNCQVRREVPKVNSARQKRKQCFLVVVFKFVFFLNKSTESLFWLGWLWCRG